MITGKKVLVTGAAGFIGSHLAEALVRQGNEVVCVDNMAAGKMHNLIPWSLESNCKIYKIPVILSDDWETTEFCARIQGLDYLFHLAASKCTVCRDDPFRDLMTNAWGTFRMAEVAQKTGAKMIHVSTGSVMGGKPVSYYGVSKLAGESYLRAFAEYYPQFNYAVVRVYHVYGPRQDDSDKGGVIPIFIRQAYNRQPLTIHGDGMQVRHFTYVGDVVKALQFYALNDFEKHYFDFLNDNKATIFDVAREISNLMDCEVFQFKYMESRPGDIRKFDKKSDIDLSDGMTSLYSGLRKTIDWYLQEYEQPNRMRAV